MFPTPQMIEAGQRAAMISNGCGAMVGDERVFCDDPRLSDEIRHTECSCKDDANAAITAALVLLPGAPVAWYLPNDRLAVTRDKEDVTDRWPLANPHADIRPLYAAPAPQPVAVKALEWAESEFRHTSYGAVGGDYTARMMRRDGLWTVDGWMETFENYEAAKAAAQADYETRIRSALVNPVPSDEQPGYQYRVNTWMLTCFGAEVAADIKERPHRFLEEAIELAQSVGTSKDEVLQLVDYVFGRPAGDPHQEVGGTVLTLSALCTTLGFDMMTAAEHELARVSTPAMIAKLQAKNAAKDPDSPLPGFASDPVSLPEISPVSSYVKKVEE